MLVIVADGFEETEVIAFMSILRQAGLCVKSVGLTSGLVSSIHGVWLMPDLTLADIDDLIDTKSVSAVILPGGRQNLSRLKADPRVHRLLRQVVAQRGRIVTNSEGLQVPRAAAIWTNAPVEMDENPELPVLLRKPEQSPEAFAQYLAQRLKRSNQT